MEWGVVAKINKVINNYGMVEWCRRQGSNILKLILLTVLNGGLILE